MLGVESTDNETALNRDRTWADRFLGTSRGLECSIRGYWEKLVGRSRFEGMMEWDIDWEGKEDGWKGVEMTWF